jgi:hypothetical protein
VADFTIKSNDRLPSIQAAFATAGAAVNLTSATSVKFIMKTATGNTVKVNTPAVIVDATTGVVRYDWLSADTATPGSYIAEWEVTWGGGKKQTFPTGTYHTVDVLADLDGA